MNTIRLLILIAGCVGTVGIAEGQRNPYLKSYIKVCNDTAGKEDLYVTMMVAKLTWDGYRSAMVGGWEKVRPGRCEIVFNSNFSFETVYVQVENKNGSQVWRSKEKSGTRNAYAGEPTVGYWCVNDNGSDEWPDNTRHPIKASPTCPSGSRVARGGSINIAQGDTFTLNIE